MKYFRALMPVGLIVVLVVVWLVTARQEMHATPGNVKLIVPGVWFREGELTDKGHCNNIWIEMKDYLIVVDANFPSGAEACLADIKKTSQKPVKYVFDTHHHGDHAYGNPVWTKLGATTLATAGVAEEMKRYEPKRWQEAAKSRQGCGCIESSQRLNLQGKPSRKTSSYWKTASRKVEFHFLGWAHTRGDGFVYLPKERVVCTGDAIVNGPYNYMGDGNSASWPKVIEKALRFDVDTVLPGHGVPGTKDLMTGQLRFFVELRKAVGDAIKSGKKIEDLVTKQGDKVTGTSLTLSDTVKNWADKERMGGQVEVVYKEITMGKPHGEILSGK